MSRRTAIVTGAVGALVGAGAGIPWLIRWEECAGLGDRSVQCTMNQTLAPFLSAIAIGFVVAVVLGNVVAVIARRSVKPNPTPRKSRAAVEIDDPMTQIAAWGSAPRREPAHREPFRAPGAPPSSGCNQVEARWAASRRRLLGRPRGANDDARHRYPQEPSDVALISLQ